MCNISIVIVTFNSEKFIKGCLDALYAQGFNTFKLIVVDNGSKDNTVSLIKENYPQVIVFENKENFGAAKARNQGIGLCTDEWVLTLDCDVVLQDNFLSEIIKLIRDLPHPRIGAIQPKVLSMDRGVVYSAGIFFSNLRRFYDIGRGESDSAKFSESKYIYGACSAAALYSRRMLEEVKEWSGYFDERFFFLVEDVDLAWRAQDKGWKTLFLPDAVCFHSGNSSGLSKQLRQYLCFRNRYFMILKNERRLPLLKLAGIFAVYDLPRILFLLLSNSYTMKGLREVIGFMRIRKNNNKFKPVKLGSA